MKTHSESVKRVGAALIVGLAGFAEAQPSANFWEIENEVQSELADSYGYYLTTVGLLQTLGARTFLSAARWITRVGSRIRLKEPKETPAKCPKAGVGQGTVVIRQHRPDLGQPNQRCRGEAAHS